MKLRLREKLLASSGALLVLMAAVAAVGVVQLDGAAQRSAGIYQQNALGIQYMLETNANMIASAREEKRAFLEPNQEKRAALIKQARDEMAAAAESLESYQVTFVNEADKQAWQDIKTDVEHVAADRTEILDLLEQGKDEQAAGLAAEMSADITEMNKELFEGAQMNAGLARESRDKAASSASSSRALLIGITAAAVVLGFGSSFWLARTLARAAGEVVARLSSLEEKDIQGLKSGLRAMASGDLTVEVTPVTAKIERYSSDEVGQAAASMNRIVDVIAEAVNEYNATRASLAALLGTVKQDAASILGASDQLGEAADQMAAATGQIASAINEVTHSTVALSSLSQESAREVERLAFGSQQVAAAAQSNAGSAVTSKGEASSMGDRILVVATASEEVARAAEESRLAAMQGQQAVSQAVASMESIARAVERAQRTIDQLGEYGAQIGDIVKVIDDIAGQTNLLALNAAIEAARAGEQGRGFAVVADNVRSLAERSSQSTKEIADLIAKVQSGTQEAVDAMAVGVHDVDEGRQITSQAGDALESIISSVQQSAAQMQRIATDVQNLASGAQRIVTSAEQIAELADESARGAGDMANGTTRVTEAIIQVSATSEETSASAEQVSASTQQLSAQSEELAATACQMRKLAESLSDAAGRFRLEGSA